MATIPAADHVEFAHEPRLVEGSRAWRKIVRNPLAIVGGLILAVVVGAAVAAPWVAPHDPAKQSLIRRFTPPVWTEKGHRAYPLGTDQVGRDILSRMIHGARISLIVGLAATLITMILGTVVGLAAGYYGGRIDTLLSAFTNWFLVIPWVALAIVLASILGPTLLNIIIVLLLITTVPAMIFTPWLTRSVTVLVAAAVGRLAWVTMPGELVTTLGREIKATARRRWPHVVVAGLSNDYLGYFVQPGDYHRSSYVTCAAVFGPHLGPCLVDTSLALMDDLTREAPKLRRAERTPSARSSRASAGRRRHARGMRADSR